VLLRGVTAQEQLRLILASTGEGIFGLGMDSSSLATADNSTPAI
jgi:hypothetical protein